MNFKEKIDNMSYRELYNVRGWVKEAIIRKLDEGKVSVWMVHGGGVNYACYPVDQYMNAATKMSELTLKHAKQYHETYIELSVEKVEIEESEVEGYFSLNEGT